MKLWVNPALRILGALGWNILGTVLLCMKLAPWWVGFLMLGASVSVILFALDELRLILGVGKQ